MNPSTHSGLGSAGSLDGSGNADHEQPYRFGWRPSASTPYPFSTRQYARLLMLRGRVRDRGLGRDDAPEQAA